MRTDGGMSGGVGSRVRLPDRRFVRAEVLGRELSAYIIDLLFGAARVVLGALGVVLFFAAVLGDDRLLLLGGFFAFDALFLWTTFAADFFFFESLPIPNLLADDYATALFAAAKSCCFDSDTISAGGFSTASMRLTAARLACSDAFAASSASICDQCVETALFT